MELHRRFLPPRIWFMKLLPCLLKDISICSDSKSVISVASSDLEPPWEIAAIISDARSLAAKHIFLFLFFPRFSNDIAHWIVRES